jgi:amino acid adenylation domain-containing protein
VLAIAGAALLLVAEGMEESAAACAPALCRHPIPIEVDAADVDDLADADDCAALAYIMFTSGSTGAPKGVAIEHRAAANTIADVNRRLGLDSADRVLAVSASTFDLSIYDLFAPLWVGGAVVFPPAAARSDPEAWVAALDQHGVTIWNSTPALMQMLLDRVGLDSIPPPGPRAALLSGDWIPVGLAERMRRAWPAIRVIGLGGATEAAIWSTWEEIARPLPGWTSVPYGTPLAHQSLDVRDEMLRPRPAWAVGDLYIGGSGLARGYYARPDLTAAAFVADPLDGKLLYRTGDLARFRADGRLEFLGREDGQVKIRGQRVELGEIEALLMRQPGVAGAVAIVHDHAILGFVVPADGGRCASQALIPALAEQLPPYAVPARIVTIDAIPLTAHGKVDTVALMRFAAAAAPQPDAASRARDPLAERFARLSGTVLSRPPPDIDEDLFLAGLDSVSAMQLIAGFYADNGHRIPLAAIFECRSARAIVATLGDREARQPSSSALAGAARFGSPVPASTMQRRLWLLDQLKPGDPRYIIPGAIVIEGPLDTAALAGAVSDVLERHAPLRTALRIDEGRLTQIVLPVPPSPLAILAGGSEAEPWQSFASRGFALDQEAPSRFRLLPDGERRWLLQFAIHHCAIDAWSIAVLARDLAALYAARRGAGERPAPLPVTYSDFASWEAAREADGSLDPELAWWGEELAGLPTQALAAGGPGEPEPVIVPIALDDAVARSLEALADRNGASLYMILVALFAQCLRRRRRNYEDLVIGSSVNGRAAAELEGLIGCFVNIVPLRLRFEGTADLDSLVQRARQAVLAALAHQSVPFERIVAAARNRGSALDPPFAAMLVLQNNPRQPIAVEGLTLSLPALESDESRYPLHLHLERGPHGLTGALRADRRGLSRTLVEAIASDFVRLAALDEARGPVPEKSVAVHKSRLAALVRRSPTGSEA